MRRPGAALRRLALAATVLAALALVPSASGADLPPTDPSAPGSADPYPSPEEGLQCVGLPLPPIPADFVFPDGLPEEAPCSISRVINSRTGVISDFSSPTNYTGVSTRGIQGAPRLGQWIRVPVLDAVAVVPIHFTNVPSDINAGTQEPAGTANVFHVYPRVWLLSEDRRSVGDPRAFTVRSLAFGTIPVEVTVHLTQPVLPDGTVEPVKARQKNSIYGRVQLLRDAVASGRLDVRLSDLVVDQIPVDIGVQCRTREPAQLDLVGLGFEQSGAGGVPEGRYSGVNGGLLSGTIDIPDFVDCTDGDEDLSALLTNAVSGDDNPISITQSGSKNTCFPQDLPVVCQADLPDLDLPATAPEVVPQQ